MRRFLLAAALAVPFAAMSSLAQPSDAVVTVNFSNPGLTPSKWTLVLHPDGSGHFQAEPGELTAAKLRTIEPGPIDRNVTLSKEFAERAFDTIRRHKLLRDGCESHLKVAFQGWKKITYSGPEGEGSCEFNYSKSKDIQALGDSFVAVAGTIVEGARLELLLQHDPLGLDQEMEYVKEALGDGRLQQVCAIQGVLTRIADDQDVMERVRKHAQQILTEFASK